MRKKFKAKWILPLCYAVLAVFWLGWAVFCFAYDRARPQTVLPHEQAQSVQLEAAQQAGGYTILGGDPQLIFTELNLNGRRLVLRANFSKDPGEMDVYYARKDGQGFGAKKRVYARVLAQGVYEYSLPPGRLTGLRVDLGTAGSSHVQVASITLNEAAPARAYFLPSLRGWLAFASLPALASCFIYIIIEIKDALFDKKSRSNREET